MPNNDKQENKAFDATDFAPVSGPAPGAETQSLWRTLNTSALSTPVPGTGSSVQGWIDVKNEHLKQIVENERNNAHPVRAALAEVYYQAQKGVTDTVAGLLTPVNTALGIVTGGSGVASQALKTAAGLYFGWRASQELVNGRLPDESTGDMIRRKALAGFQLVTSGESAATGAVGAANAAQDYIQNSMGLKGNLAAKVEAQVSKSKQLDEAVPTNLNAIKQTAVQVVAQKNAEFNTEYAKLNAKAINPVTTVTDIKSEVINDLKAAGVSDPEIAKITPSIFASLPKGEVTEDLAPTAAVNAASMLGSQLRKQGLAVDDVRTALTNLGYVPRQVQTAVAMVFPDLPKDTSNVSYEMTRRLKTDIWQAAQSTKDTDMYRGLSAAQDNISGIRDRYAQDMGFGKEHAALDARYMQFKRDLGSGTMSDFTQANDFHDQNTVLSQSKTLTSDSGEALRGLFKLAGVDTSPLKDALENKKAFDESPTIIPGKSDLALTGKGSLQIRQEALKALGDNAKKSGITNPYAFTQIMYGVAQLGFGSMFGVMHISKGLAPTGITNMLRSESFQNWVAQESGVTPQAMPKFRDMVSKSAPYLQKMALSTSLAGATDAANQKKPSKTISILPEPSVQSAPAPSGGQIRISQ